MTDSEKLDLLVEKLGGVENRMDSMEGKMSSMEGKMSSMEGKMNSMEGKMNSMEGKMNSLEERLISVESDVKGIKIKIENELSNNIRLIAEGHLDLSRELHDVLRSANSLEMLSIKVNVLESKVRELERRAQA